MRAPAAAEHRRQFSRQDAASARRDGSGTTAARSPTGRRGDGSRYSTSAAQHSRPSRPPFPPPGSADPAASFAGASRDARSCAAGPRCPAQVRRCSS
eukprot:scaffold144824_cov362-Phaeocystis_antarctica.AAC.1